jgi:hypothetical protein
MNYRARNGFTKSKKGPTPALLKIFLFLFISLLALLALRLFPSTFQEGFRAGWIPAVSLLLALGLIARALIEIVRTR